MKTIRVTRQQIIGRGSYATVYRISPRRVVKVFSSSYKENERQHLIKDEIKGSKRKFCLPVLKVAEVKLPSGRKTLGLVKRYIPRKVSFREVKDFARQHKIRYWDYHEDNVRKDSRGRIYMVDTQINGKYTS